MHCKSLSLYTIFHSFRNSLIYQGTSTRRPQNDLFSLRVKLPPVTSILTMQSH